MAEQTDVPAFVSRFMGPGTVPVLCWTGLTWFKTPLDQRVMAGRNKSKPSTPVVPAKIAARLCVLISVNRESAVKIACDLSRVNMAEPRRVLGESCRLPTGAYKTGDGCIL